jgi:hypothetical protein
MSAVSVPIRHDVKKNIFPGAHDAIREPFPWHRGAAQPHSSQALAVSVFGTLAVHPEREVLVETMLRFAFGWDPTGENGWRVDLEKTMDRSLLGEWQPTQIDVLLSSETSAVALECKFTEAGGGTCSQVKPKPPSSGVHKGLRQCDGTYREQRNPANNKTARCALSAKGVRYWTHIPTYLDVAADQDHVPCPFAGPAYQYMRTVLAVGEWVRQQSRERAAGLLVYVAGKDFPVSVEVSDPTSEWNRFIARMRSDSLVAVKAISYQEILEIWCQCLPRDEVLAELRGWVHGRISVH